MRMRAAVAAFGLACGWIGLGCGGGGTPAPTSPGSPSGSGASCRTYPTVQQSVTRAGSFTDNTTVTESFNASTHQGTLTTQSSNSSGCVINATSVATYNSVADFVDEVSVIPPLVLERSSTTNTAASGSCSSISGPSNVSYSYNGQRLTQYVATAGLGSTTTTLTAWDSFNRPTAGTISTGPVAISYVYNNTARTSTLTAAAGTDATVVVTTYDANGNQVLATSTSGGNTSTSTTTITSTATVCK